MVISAILKILPRPQDVAVGAFLSTRSQDFMLGLICGIERGNSLDRLRKNLPDGCVTHA